MLLEYLTDKPYRQFSESLIKISKQEIEFGEYLIKNLNLKSKQMIENIRKYYPADEDKIGKVQRFSYDLKTPSKNPLRFYGDVYALTSRQTFSSATSFTSAIKDFHLGTIVGEETGGLPSCYGDVISFNLPNSGLGCGCSHTYFLRPSGEDTGRGVIPDFEVKPEPEDLVTGRDRVMEFTIELIESPTLKTCRQFV
jgi:Periplasmic protease